MRDHSSGEHQQRCGAGPARHRSRPRGAAARGAWTRSRRRSTPTSRAGSRSSPRRPRTCSTPAASGSGRCWCCWPPRPARSRPPTRSSPPPASWRSPTSARSTTTTSWTRPTCAAGRRRPTPAGTTTSRSSPATSCSRSPPSSPPCSAPTPSGSRPRPSPASSRARSSRPSPPAPTRTPSQHYLQVVAGKTGSLIATSARYGARFGGTSAEVEEALAAYGEIVGSAFQLSDDIIDVASDSTESGKTPGTDLREGVPTLPTLMAQASTDPADARLLELLGQPLTDDAEHAEALALLRAHPAMAQARAYVVDRADEAKALLGVLPAGPGPRRPRGVRRRRRHPLRLAAAARSGLVEQPDRFRPHAVQPGDVTAVEPATRRSAGTPMLDARSRSAPCAGGSRSRRDSARDPADGGRLPVPGDTLLKCLAAFDGYAVGLPAADLARGPRPRRRPRSRVRAGHPAPAAAPTGCSRPRRRSRRRVRPAIALVATVIAMPKARTLGASPELALTVSHRHRGRVPAGAAHRLPGRLPRTPGRWLRLPRRGAASSSTSSTSRPRSAPLRDHRRHRTQSRVRRQVLVHAALSFLFNTLILAVAVTILTSYIADVALRPRTPARPAAAAGAGAWRPRR